MKLRILKFEEEQMNFMMFFVSIAVSVIAYWAVMIFLEGTAIDALVLLMVAAAVLIRLLEKRLGEYAKYFYISIMPLVGPIVIVIGNDGRFVAMTQAYFLWLFLGIAYYDTSVVKVCVSVTFIANLIGAFLSPASYLKLHPMVAWAFIVIVYLIAVVAAVIITERARELFEMERQLKIYENDLEYFQALQKKDEKYSEFIHNINHYFKAIGELAKQENHGDILGILDTLSVELENNERIIYTNHRIANAVLSEKRAEAESKGVIFDAYVEQGSCFGKVSDGDLVAMLGNLLDNAITAAEKCLEGSREVVVRVYMENRGRVCVVKITNSFVEEPVKGRTGFVSTKREEGLHGIGIKSVENMAEKYGGYLECLPEENSFTALLILPVEK